MKITKKILEKIIKEELSKVIKEYDAEEADALLQQLEKPTGMIGTGASGRAEKVADDVAVKKAEEEEAARRERLASSTLNPAGPHKLSDMGEIKSWIRFILGQLDEIDY